MEAERPKQRRWSGVDDPISHGPAGHRNDAPGPDHCGEAARAGRGGAPGVQDGRSLGAQVRARGERAKAGLAGGGGDHAVDMALWADLACVGLNADVKFLLGDFRQLPAVLDSWAGRPISAPLEHSQLIRDLAGGHRRKLTENMRSNPGIFNFVKWLRVGKEACPTLEQAKARLKELYPSKRMAVNAAANRALAPEASKLLELETQVIHIDLGETQNGCSQTQNSPQSMRVWPGLRLIGAGGKIPKGVFVAVAEVDRTE